MRRWLALAPLLLACNAGPDEPGVMYMPEMVVSTPYDAHDRNPILPNGMTLQAPPEGSVPRGFEPFHYAAEEAELAAELANPIAPDEAALARGRAQFETFCSVCHGARGAGDGPVVPPFPNPPALRAERLTTMSDGQLFHVITRGKGLMPQYATQVRADDRWRIVHYVRTLQGVEPGSVPAATTAEEAPLVEPALEEPALEEPALEEPALEEPALEEPALDAPADAAAPAAVRARAAPVEEAAPPETDAPLPPANEPTGETDVR